MASGNVVSEGRFDRNVKLFGREGQDVIQSSKVAIVGLGGVGSHLAQGLTYLGVQQFVLIDDDVVTTSSLNRLVGATPEDANVGAPKVDVAKRMILSVEPDAKIEDLRDRAVSAQVAHVARGTDIVFGCVDSETPRLQLTELAANEGRPYVDCASDVDTSADGLRYGGRVQVFTGDGCLSCLGELDQRMLRAEAASPDQLRAEEAIYGVPHRDLDGDGPSVIGLNGVVANVALTEAMCLLTGLRRPIRLLMYHAHFGIVSIPKREPDPDCYYCRRWQESSH